MEKKRYSASQSANIIRNWLWEETEDDDSNCSFEESSDDEVDDFLIEDAAETDDSNQNSAEENDVFISSMVSTASAEYLGKSGRLCSNTPPPTFRTRGSNIFTVINWGVQISPQNKVECFDSFFSPAMLDHSLKYTNQHAAAHYARKKVQWGPTDMVELKTFFGILYLLGVSKGYYESIKNLWSNGPMARPFFKATMSVNRFESICCHLIFDSMDTREERRALDKFAPFREVWNFFESKCRKNYQPSAELCIDKQLIEMLLKKTTYVGTLQKNKSDIPAEFQANKTRPIRLTLFGFDKDTTMALFFPKKLKSVLLVSTMHHDDKIDDQTGKPDIIFEL